jgi:DNA-binding HxlR family transcriptional regulator
MKVPFDSDIDIYKNLIAKMLEIIGDKWSLLIICELVQDKKSFGELVNSVNGISTNILTNRLRRLEKAGILTRSNYSDKPVRCLYQLTVKGMSLQQVLEPMAVWAKVHLLD